MKARQCTISLERASGSHALLLHVRDIVRNQFMVASGRQAFQYRRMLIVYHKNERIFNCVRVVNHNVYRQPSLKKIYEQTRIAFLSFKAKYVIAEPIISLG